MKLRGLRVWEARFRVSPSEIEIDVYAFWFGFCDRKEFKDLGLKISGFDNEVWHLVGP